MLFDESSEQLKKQIFFNLRLPQFQFTWMTLLFYETKNLEELVHKLLK